MKPTKHKYSVFAVGEPYGPYCEGDSIKYYIGDTWAVSAAKAESQVRFREMRNKKEPNGGYSTWDKDMGGESGYSFHYQAELIY